MVRHLYCILSFAFAGTAGAATLPLDQAADYALAHNPHLAVARLRIEEARGRMLGAGRLRNPELEVEFGQNVRAPERGVRLEFMQWFPLTSRLQLEKAVSLAQLAAAEAELRDAERRLAADVGAAAVKLIALRAQQELRQEQLANSREQAQFIITRATAGEASAVDAAQVELEAQQLEVELLELDFTHATLTGELRPLLGLEAHEGIEISGTLAAPDAVLVKIADGYSRPDLEVARHATAAAHQAVRLAKARRWEDLGVGFMASGERTEDVPQGFANDNFVGVRLSLPLPFWNKNEGQIAEAKVAAVRAAMEADALASAILSEGEAARGEMVALSNLVVAMDSALLPKAMQLEAQMRAAYDAGQLSLTEALRARARRLELAQRRVDALRDYHLARVRFEAAIGGKAGK